MKVSRAVAVLLAVASVAAVTGVASARTAHTRALIFRAFTAGGSPAFRIARTVHGSCNGGSSATDRSDAWRCFSGNLVYDPCFSSPKAAGYVICGALPWHRVGIKLRFSGRLTFGHTARPSKSGLPWAIQTMSGDRCVIDTGASNFVDGKRANYYCSATDWLWGSPSRHSEPWTIVSAPEDATTLHARVAIRSAWF